MARLQVRLLGGFEARLASGRELALKGRKAQALLAYLAVAPGVARSRDRLTGLLWSDRAEEQARGSLRQALTELRRALDGIAPPPLDAGREAVTLDAHAVDSDVASFERLIAEGGPGALARAAELYRGELLEGLGAVDPAFDDWLAVERSRLGELALGALGALLDHLTEVGETERAVALARRLLALDPLREPVHRALMRLYATQGDRALALKQYQACREVLARELDVAPEAETEALHEELRSGGPAKAATTSDEPSKVAALPLPDKPSIAVLPFVNISGDAEQEYFSDGITEDIITGLSRFRELFVIARNSTFTYKGQAVDVTEVGVKLGVQYVVEGSVRKVGNRVRVSAQLVDAMTGSHVWAERYDRGLEDVFAVQDEITETVVATLAGRLSDLGVDRAKRKPTQSLTAFDYVLHARQLIYRYKQESILDARELLERAIALDPDYATAHAWLSETYWTEWLGGWTTNAVASFEQSARAAAQAVALDDTDPQAHIQMGQICIDRRQYDVARFHFDKAQSLNPNDPNATMMQSYYSTCVGDPERAVAQIDEAIRVDPLGHYGFPKGIAHYTARNYETAIAALKTVRGDALGVLAWLAACHARIGNRAEAQAAMAEFVARSTKAMTGVGARPPANWLEFFAARYPYKHEADLDHLLDGLRKAGLE